MDLNGRIFQEIVVEYPSISTYPECEGKPYFSIKYTENGQGFIGYGTYKPEVLSEYLKEYFMTSAQPSLDEWCTDCKEYDKERNSCPRWNRVIRETLKDMKEAQPEIIRCKDCRHYNAGFECLIEGYGIERNKDWFCGDAERRTDETTI